MIIELKNNIPCSKSNFNNSSKFLLKRFFSAEKDNLDLPNFVNLNLEMKIEKIQSMNVSGLKNLSKLVKLPQYRYLNKKKLVEVLTSHCVNLKTILEVPPSYPGENLKKTYLLLFVNEKGQIDVSRFGIKKTVLNSWFNVKRFKTQLSIHCIYKKKPQGQTSIRVGNCIYLDKELAFFTALKHYPSLHAKLKESCLAFGVNENIKGAFYGKRDFNSKSINLDLEAFVNQSKELRAIKIRKMNVTDLKNMCSLFKIPKYGNLKRHELILSLNICIWNLRGLVKIPSLSIHTEIKRFIFLIVNHKGQIDISTYTSTKRHNELWLSSKEYKLHLENYCRRKNTTAEKCQTKNNGRIYLDKELALLTALHFNPGLYYNCWELSSVFDL